MAALKRENLKLKKDLEDAATASMRKVCGKKKRKEKKKEKKIETPGGRCHRIYAQGM